jgi:hypothetical protein
MYWLREMAPEIKSKCVRWAMKITAGLSAEFTATSCDAKMSLYQEHLHVKVSATLSIAG